jgi:hypothetical protein
MREDYLSHSYFNTPRYEFKMRGYYSPWLGENNRALASIRM